MSKPDEITNYHETIVEIDRTLKFLRQDPAEALRLFDRQIAENPRNRTTHLHRSFALDRLGRPEDTLAACSDALAVLDPGVAHQEAALLTVRARLHQKLGHYSAAVADYDRSQALNSEVFGNDIDAACRIECLIQSGDAIRALAECDTLNDTYYPRFLGVPGETKSEIREAIHRRLGSRPDSPATP